MKSFYVFLALLLVVGVSAGPTPDPDGMNVTSPPAFCPDGWIYVSISGNCYKALNGTLSPMDGAAACAGLGASLVSITNRFVNYMVMGMALAAQSWIEYVAIGYQYNDTTQSWSWPDGTPSNFTLWQRGNPIVPSLYSCTLMQARSDDAWKLGHWTSAWCYQDSLIGVVCQRAANSLN